MFSFSGAKVRRFSYMHQIFRYEKTKISTFVDINQNHHIENSLQTPFKALYL